MGVGLNLIAKFTKPIEHDSLILARIPSIRRRVLVRKQWYICGLSSGPGLATSTNSRRSPRTTTTERLPNAISQFRPPKLPQLALTFPRLYRPIHPITPSNR
jgi:hypothetical protein